MSMQMFQLLQFNCMLWCHSAHCTCIHALPLYGPGTDTEMTGTQTDMTDVAMDTPHAIMTEMTKAHLESTVILTAGNLFEDK